MPAVSPIGKHFSELQTPALLLDEAVFRANCQAMLDVAKANGMRLRGQTKTHKTIEGGVLQTGGSKRCVVVSTLREAETYAEAGFDDILYGYPLTPVKIPRCAALHAQLTHFSLLVDNTVILEALEAYQATNATRSWKVFVKVDCGGGRVGVLHDSPEGLKVAHRIATSASVAFQGLYAHGGDSYSSGDPAKTGRDTAERVSSFADRLSKLGVECATVGMGSTPTATHPLPCGTRVNELHPGNYVFFDAMQMSIGSCRLEQIAVTVATRVVGHYPQRNEALVDAGFAALTAQGLDQAQRVGHRHLPVMGWENLRISGMTQELGKLTTIDGSPLPFHELPIGALLRVYPWHSCATAAQFPVYHVIEANGKVRDLWAPCRGW